MKRFPSDSPDQNNECKRSKPSINDLWDDDPEIDDYLVMASQLCEQQQNESHSVVLPGYTTFNVGSKLCSTQTDNNRTFVNIPSTSFNTCDSSSDLARKLAELQMRYEAKEGEATILRTQLNQTKEQLQSERTKRIQETNQEIQTAKQNADKYYTQLEFVKLDMLNLKRKLSNVTKNNTLDVSLTQSKIACSAIYNEKSFNASLSGNSLLSNYSYIKPCSPMNNPFRIKIPESFFRSSIEDDLFPKIIQNHGTQRDENVGSLLFPKKILKLPICKFSIKHIYPDVYAILQGGESARNINKVLMVFLNMLMVHLEYLSEMKEFIGTQEILEMDLRRLQQTEEDFNINDKCFYSARPWCSNESAIQCRQCLILISNLLPHCNYLQGVLLHDKAIVIEDDQYEEPIKFSKSWTMIKKNVKFTEMWWQTMQKFVVVIGRVRQGYSYTGFLSSLCQLLSNSLSVLGKNTERQFIFYEQFFGIIKEIVLTLPQGALLYHLSNLLKNASAFAPVAGLLCAGPPKTHVIVKIPKGVVLVNRSCCTFEVFCILVTQVLRKLDDRVMENVLYVISNLFRSNVSWLYPDENKHYECRKGCFTLLAEIISLSARKFRNMDHHESSFSVNFNILRIGTSVLAECNYRFRDLLEDHSQLGELFKSCKKLLLALKNDFPGFCEFDVPTLEKLSLNESVTQ